MSVTAPSVLPHVEVDFNVRSGDGWVRTRLAKVSNPQQLQTGSAVWVVERHEALRGLATVAKIDHERNLLYLDVDWGSVEPVPESLQTSNANWELQRLSGGRLGVRVSKELVTIRGSEFSPPARPRSAELTET